MVILGQTKALVINALSPAEMCLERNIKGQDRSSSYCLKVLQHWNNLQSLVTLWLLYLSLSVNTKCCSCGQLKTLNWVAAGSTLWTAASRCVTNKQCLHPSVQKRSKIAALYLKQVVHISQCLWGLSVLACSLGFSPLQWSHCGDVEQWADRPAVITGNSWVVLGSVYMMCDHLCPELMTKKWNLLVKIINTERSHLAVLFAQLLVNLTYILKRQKRDSQPIRDQIFYLCLVKEIIYFILFFFRYKILAKIFVPFRWER